MANLLPITSSKRFVPGCGADDLAGKGQQLLRRGTFALGQVVSPAQGFGPRPSCGAWAVKRDPGIASAGVCRLCWAVGQSPREDLRRWCSRRDLNPRPAGQKYRTRQSGGYEPPALPLGDCCINPAALTLCLRGECVDFGKLCRRGCALPARPWPTYARPGTRQENGQRRRACHEKLPATACSTVSARCRRASSGGRIAE